MDVQTAHDPHAVDAREAARLDTLRRQMREQDQNRYRDPDAKDPRREIYVMYVWRRCPESSVQIEKWNEKLMKNKKYPVWKTYKCVHCGSMLMGLKHKCFKPLMWYLLAFKHDTPTPKRLRRWRRKLKVGDTEMVRVVDLATAQRFGAGTAPQLPPQSKRPERLRKLNRAIQQQVITFVVPKKHRTHPSLTKCDHVTRGKRCGIRAAWYVAYTSPRSRTRILKRRCTKHGWYDRYLPADARHIVRVRREVKR